MYNRNHKSTPMIPIKLLMHISAAKEKVFKALTESNELSKWYTTIVKGEFKLNEIITFEFVNFAEFKFKDDGEDYSISSSKSSNLSEDLAHTTTFAPALASINEVALPMPFDAPHTSAFLPFSIPSA